ncbi:hypothetical protein K443DRAFT_88620 [Laccaria amethystina LaAM-08-1]|uniref:Beta-catenin-like protein 1 N-terminal domain-containing protein n=1 Tax=Laccaria amethystina LaAM-08-1 TaxID=1095629 RepID=A0A0C9Y8U6_9AGAR|nr:hypothetical protein K443DRAFT_88620 [Laccaria amethystina LaAM-08-1]
MDIDKLFKVPKLPAGGNKRKFPDNPTPEMLKKLKMDSSTPSVFAVDPSRNYSTQAKGETKSATIQDAQDQVADESFAPGGDADYFAEEDGEGRFFGGGLTSEQKTILNIFDKSVGEGIQDVPQELSITLVRKSLLNFERCVNKNQEQRSKYPNDPSRFIDSEADLDSAIKSMLSLSQAPVLAYPELVRSGAVALLIGLLAHENVDIAIDVVELIHELTDEDVGNDLENDEELEDTEAALKLLIDSLVEYSILELLVDNLSRMNEAEESDKQGVFHVLAVFENILGYNSDLASELVSKTNVLPWLLNRLQSKTHDENRVYAAELLSILLQNNVDNRIRFAKEDGVELLLKVVSQYRRKDPVDPDETEFMENLFDSLCSVLNEPSIKQLFLSAEGPDLMILMMKENMQSKSRAIKALDYAMSGTTSSGVCESFVEALGLKVLFAALMGKSNKKHKTHAASPASASEDITHILGIISSLFTHLASDSRGRIRLLTKFVEGDYEKVDRLIELRDAAQSRLRMTDLELDAERQLSENGEATSSDSTYIRRLEGGLFTLQTLDYILAWLIMEDDGIRLHVIRMLSRKNQSVNKIVETLRVHYDNLQDEKRPNDAKHHLSQREIIQGLIAALEPSQENT